MNSIFEAEPIVNVASVVNKTTGDTQQEQEVPVFIKDKKIPELNYDYAQFASIYTAYQEFSDTFLNQSVMNSRAGPSTALKLFKNFFEKLTKVQEGFQSVVTVQLTDPSLSDEFQIKINEWKDRLLDMDIRRPNPADIEVLKNEITQYIFSKLPPSDPFPITSFSSAFSVSSLRGGQRGGAPADVYLYLEPVLNDICMKAEIALDSILSESFPLINIKYLIDSYVQSRQIPERQIPAFITLWEVVQVVLSNIVSEYPSVLGAQISSTFYASVGDISYAINSANHDPYLNALNSCLNELNTYFIAQRVLKYTLIPVDSRLKYLMLVIVNNSDTVNTLNNLLIDISSTWLYHLKIVQDYEGYNDDWGIVSISFLLSFYQGDASNYLGFSAINSYAAEVYNLIILHNIVKENTL